MNQNKKRIEQIFYKFKQIYGLRVIEDMALIISHITFYSDILVTSKDEDEHFCNRVLDILKSLPKDSRTILIDSYIRCWKKTYEVAYDLAISESTYFLKKKETIEAFLYRFDLVHGS